ncbi:VanZ family protein [Pseudalkalibacillus hwajinpoensis]|uniref:VanZ family protein n=1 Tax=Guptibacillus hwajinpoensis TaxID=208199 RepID=UPI00325BCB65
MTFFTYWKWPILALIMMGVLFISSHTPYQEQDLKPFFKDFITITENDLPDVEFTYDGALVTPSEPYQYVEFFLRKAAHVGSFGLLAFFCVMTFKKRSYGPIYGSLVAFGYAMFDEFHQSLIEGRTGHLIDVLVPDTMGILITFLATTILLKRRTT